MPTHKTENLDKRQRRESLEDLQGVNEMEKIRKDIVDIRDRIDRLYSDVQPGMASGLRDILTNKNILDPGHEHLFPPRDKTLILSYFNSLDGWNSGGVGTEVITAKIGGLSITTGGSTNDDAWITADTTGFNSFDVSKSSAFQSVLKFSSASDVTGYFGAGDITSEGAFGSAAEEGYGFKYVNGTLSALSVESGNETLTTIGGITATNFNEYRAIFNTSEDGPHSVSYFVNGKFKATHRANMPNTDEDIFETFYIKTTANAAKTMFVKYSLFVQQN